MFSIGVSCWYYEVILQKRKFNMAKKYSNTGYCKCILIILANLSSGEGPKKYMYSWMV